MKYRVIEHYELVRKLGTGGSGVVFLANDTQLQRPVVLKLLQRGTLTTEQMRTTYLREARLASAIEHPNVCAIYDVGEVDDEAYIVMQYVPGRPLDRLIEGGPANVELVLSVGIQTADGLAAAHSLGIFHRDLKPANLILTDGGLLKILDFGLARRIPMEDTEFDPAIHAERKPPTGTYTARGGTIAYMAPEQFVTGQSSVQSDIFALGVVLYELLTGRHPFHRPDTPDFQTIRAIQFVEPQGIHELVPSAPVELESAILHCLQKQPGERFNSAAELRESLRTILKASQLDGLVTPAVSLSVQNSLEFRTPEEEKRSTGLLSMLAERFRESGGNLSHNTIVVLPFVNMGSADAAVLYGHALADAISARLARMQSLIVRPSSTLMNVPPGQLDPLSVGRRLQVEYVVAGSFLRSDKGFDLNWQMLHIPEQAVRAGGSINVESFDLVAVQSEISTEIFSALRGGVGVRSVASSSRDRGDIEPGPLDGEGSEEYLQARALLSSFMFRTGSPEDLQRATELFSKVVQRDPSYAPGWSGLGITHLQYLRHGLGGQMHLLEMRRALDKALALDPTSVEANLYRVYMLLSRGEKESARHGISNLLQTAGNNWNVHRIAGMTLRSDGQYDEALKQFGISLRLNPSDAPIIYNHRARVYQYQNQFELAEEEIQKGLTLEPRQPMLCITRGYQYMRQGHLEQAITTLERVIAEDTTLRIVYPTIAMCYAMLGERDKAASFIVEETLAAAEADSEMAYRLATYFAVGGESGEALHWLRRAVYLGNENYPWFVKNPAWSRLQGSSELDLILNDLKKSYQRNTKNWKRLLSQLAR